MLVVLSAVKSPIVRICLHYLLNSQDICYHLTIFSSLVFSCGIHWYLQPSNWTIYRDHIHLICTRINYKFRFNTFIILYHHISPISCEPLMFVISTLSSTLWYMEVSLFLGVSPVLIHLIFGFSINHPVFGVPPWLWKPLHGWCFMVPRSNRRSHRPDLATLATPRADPTNPTTAPVTRGPETVPWMN